jgi:hypothetical protein
VLLTLGVDTGDTSTRDYFYALTITVGVTTVVWLTVTMLTPPESDETLNRFYVRVRPGGAGWRSIAKWAGFKHDKIPGGVLSWVNWVAGVVAVYSAVFAGGEFIVGSPLKGAVYTAVAIGGFALIHRNLARDSSFLPGVDTAPAPPLGFQHVPKKPVPLSRRR